MDLVAGVIAVRSPPPPFYCQTAKPMPQPVPAGER